MRLVVATLYPFGLQRGVGLDTLSAFFVRLRLESQRGRSPTALRGVMQTMAATMLETAAAWEQDGVAAGEVRDIIGAVDETCLEHLMLVFQDVATGSLLLEAVADDRTYATWKTVGDQRLAEWGAGVLSLVSDRAKALIQRAAQGLECLRSSRAMRSPWGGACGKRARRSRTLRRSWRTTSRGPTPCLTAQTPKRTWRQNEPRGSNGTTSNAPTGTTSQPSR